MSRDAEGVARDSVARVPGLWGARCLPSARGSRCPGFGGPRVRLQRPDLGGARVGAAAARGAGGQRSAAGGLGRRRYEQPDPAGSCPGLARAEAAAPAPAPPGARAPAPAPARAALHRGLAAPPPAGAYLPARRSALRLARLCPPRRARAPRTRTPAAPSRRAPRAWSCPPPREPLLAPPAFRPRRVLAPALPAALRASFLGQSPRGVQNEVREGSGESQRVTWSSCLVPEGPDCPRLFQSVLAGRSLDPFQRRKINPSPSIPNALTHSTTGPSVHPPVCPFILPPIHPISTRPQAELASPAVRRRSRCRTLSHLFGTMSVSCHRVSCHDDNGLNF
ncbi:atherin-like [Meriones unguiculatus]|uniref:atherin-like n=1 Tax=Meriones unguiculatus TaxID=10047 RepID=UPI00293F1329|nr:atherin-like [Meriones unguiculatus]